MKKKVNIFWFRRDLRLNDNTGLHHCLKNEENVIPIFIFDKKILSRLKEKNDRRINIIHTSLKDIQNELRKLNSDIEILYGDVQEIWNKILTKYNVQSVYFNEDYEPQAIARDKQISRSLKKHNIEIKVFKDQCIFAKSDILKKDKTPYTVYTAYKNKWLEQLMPQDILSHNSKKFYKSFYHFKTQDIMALEELGFQENHSFTLKKSLSKSKIKNYDLYRDIPSKDATTKMSTYLRFGLISPRLCIQQALNLNKTWLEELIWREFFMQILYHFPYVTKGPFKQKYSNIKWINNKSDFKKWCEGQTGYPLVDAGIRELNATGFMHNRVRMVVASFLVKDLLIDWRWGEKYFAQKLIDFELSSNNGNWQWVAGTGCDSAPYFRIFNPDTQLKKFDPDYKYVKKWVPEFGTDQYAQKMIDHNFAYHRALQIIKDGIS